VMLRCRDRKFRYIAILFVGLRLAWFVLTSTTQNVRQ